MSDDLHLSDVQTLRDRARQHVENGAVTEGYSADREEVLRLLNAVLALGVQHIIVCGHSDCGAMKAVLNPASLDGMPTVRAWLRHAEVARSVVADNCNCGSAHETLGVLTEENVVAQLDHLRTHPSVAARLASGQLQIHGWVYDIDSGGIRAYDAASGHFLALDGDEQPCATPQPRYASA